MKITDVTKHKKDNVTHQMMMHKLCTYDHASDLRKNVINLRLLKEKAEASNYFFGKFRIPKFTFEVDGLQLYLKMEYMFGKQLYKTLVTSELRHLVWTDLVNVDGSHGFRDFNLDNFIRRGTKKLAADDPYWEYAFVDLEAYEKNTKEQRITSFDNDEQWQL